MTFRLQAQAKPPATTPALPAFSPLRAGILQRQCACGDSSAGAEQCEDCANEPQDMQRSVAHHAEPATVPGSVHDVLRSSGQPLDPQTRGFMERRLGHNFGHVRVHTDDRAAESARAVNALAYTVGRDVVFGAGQYVPRTAVGDRLLAHELTHVGQQSQQGNTLRRMEIGPADSPHEREAEQVAAGLPARDILEPHDR
jgi:hypothetical protein